MTKKKDINATVTVTITMPEALKEELSALSMLTVYGEEITMTLSQKLLHGVSLSLEQQYGIRKKLNLDTSGDRDPYEQALWESDLFIYKTMKERKL